jgi:hypothetical protein
VPSPVIRVTPFLLVQNRETPHKWIYAAFTEENLCPAFRQMGEAGYPSYCLQFHCLQFKLILISKWSILGWSILFPFTLVLFQQWPSRWKAEVFQPFLSLEGIFRQSLLSWWICRAISRPASSHYCSMSVSPWVSSCLSDKRDDCHLRVSRRDGRDKKGWGKPPLLTYVPVLHMSSCLILATTLWGSYYYDPSFTYAKTWVSQGDITHSGANCDPAEVESRH